MNRVPGMHQYAFKIIPELGLIVEFHSGLMNLEAAKAIKEEELAHDNFSSTYNILVDLSSTVFNVIAEDAKELYEFVSKNDAIDSSSRKVAFLTSESDQVAMASVYRMFQEGNQNRYRVFSTLEHALMWLGVDDHFHGEVTDELDALKSRLL